MPIAPSIEYLPHLLQTGLHAYIDSAPHVSANDVAVLYIDIVGFSRFEQNHGSAACMSVLAVFERVLLDSLFSDSFPWPGVHAFHIMDDGFAVLLPAAAKRKAQSFLVHRFVTALEDLLNREISGNGQPSLRLRHGLSSSLPETDCGDPVEHLYRLIIEAGRLARRHPSPPPLHLVEEMQRIIETQGIRMHYQPIRQLRTGQTVGWECLARGPVGSELESPLALFDCATRVGCLFEVEQMCRTQAIRNAKIDPDSKLFINISPNILSDPFFRDGETRVILEQYGWHPQQIVFEITEHHAIKEYSSFQQIITHYRRQGYRIAIDDVGAGHSGLMTLMQVKPDFVKIDMELIRGIERDRTRQDIVQAICQISRGFGATTIAEGIETSAELQCMRRCGIDHGQGYLLGRPAPSPER
ncbi:MAG: EAL domain-containing protein [Bacilli bacterium]